MVHFCPWELLTPPVAPHWRGRAAARSRRHPCEGTPTATTAWTRRFIFVTFLVAKRASKCTTGVGVSHSEGDLYYTHYLYFTSTGRRSRGMKEPHVHQTILPLLKKDRENEMSLTNVSNQLMSICTATGWLKPLIQDSNRTITDISCIRRP